MICETVVKRLGKQTDWEKMFERLISDERLSSKIYKEHLKHNNKKSDSHFKKWAQDFNRCLIKEHTDGNQHKKASEKCKLNIDTTIMRYIY